MRTMRLSLAGTVILALLGWSGGAVPAQADDSESPDCITFYHTADLHESGERLPQIAAFVESRKHDDPNVLFVDSGDWFNKGDLTPLNTRGEAMTAMLGASQHDAMILGNHGHSFGTERLAESIDRFAFPVVAANVVWPEGMEPEHALPYRGFDIDRVTVAIIGTAAACDSGSTSRCGDRLLEVLPVEGSIGGLLAMLEERADITVLLTHHGANMDMRLARLLPGVDIIFGGHTHALFDEVVIADGTDTIIQHSGSNGRVIGELTVTWDGEGVVEPELRLVLVTDELPVSGAVEGTRQEYLSQAQ